MGEYLDAVVDDVGDIDLVLRPKGNIERQREFSRIRAEATEGADRTPRGQLLDPGVDAVGNEDLALRVDGDAERVVELPEPEGTLLCCWKAVMAEDGEHVAGRAGSDLDSIVERVGDQTLPW